MKRSKYAPMILVVLIILFCPVWSQATDIQHSKKGKALENPLIISQKQINLLATWVNALKAENGTKLLPSWPYRMKIPPSKPKFLPC